GLVTAIIMAILTTKITLFAGAIAIGSIAVLAFLIVVVADRLTRETEPGPVAVAGAAPVVQKKRGIAGWKLALTAGLVATVTFVGSIFYARRPAALSDKDTIVISDFENKTGDAVFDDALRQGLSLQLEQSPFLSLISESKINQTLK